MARPKDPNFRTKIEEIREKMDEERQVRMEQNKPAALEDEEAREAFRNYWALNKVSFNQSKEVEEIVWAHLKSTGHDQPEDFDDGILHFGFKK